MPHGDAYQAWKEATTRELKPEVAGKGALSESISGWKMRERKLTRISGFMLHLNNHIGLTKFAIDRNPAIKRKASATE
jgi:homogentisate 1,2-dioxygenase